MSVPSIQCREVRGELCLSFITDSAVHACGLVKGHPGDHEDIADVLARVTQERDAAVRIGRAATAILGDCRQERGRGGTDIPATALELVKLVEERDRLKALLADTPQSEEES